MCLSCQETLKWAVNKPYDGGVGHGLASEGCP